MSVHCFMFWILKNTDWKPNQLWGREWHYTTTKTEIFNINIIVRFFLPVHPDVELSPGVCRDIHDFSSKPRRHYASHKPPADFGICLVHLWPIGITYDLFKESAELFSIVSFIQWCVPQFCPRPRLALRFHHEMRFISNIQYFSTLCRF